MDRASQLCMYVCSYVQLMQGVPGERKETARARKGEGDR